MTRLKEIAVKMDIPIRKTKEEMISDIKKGMKEYEEYKKEKVDRYERLSQLGEKGKEGTTYLVIDKKNGKEYAMKTFRKTKSSKNLKKEYKLQKIASKEGIAPKVHDYDVVSKYIVMEKMDSHLYDIIRKKGLSKKHQKRIFEIYTALDKVGIFHNDANLYNYMLKNNVVYIIDFGFAKSIDSKLTKELGKNINSRLMLLGFILKLKELGISEKSYSYFLTKLNSEDRKKYGL